MSSPPWSTSSHLSTKPLVDNAGAHPLFQLPVPDASEYFPKQVPPGPSAAPHANNLAYGYGEAYSPGESYGGGYSPRAQQESSFGKDARRPRSAEVVRAPPSRIAKFLAGYNTRNQVSLRAVKH